MWVSQSKSRNVFRLQNIKYWIRRLIPKNIFASKTDHISGVDVQNYLRITDA